MESFSTSKLLKMESFSTSKLLNGNFGTLNYQAGIIQKEVHVIQRKLVIQPGSE